MEIVGRHWHWCFPRGRASRPASRLLAGGPLSSEIARQHGRFARARASRPASRLQTGGPRISKRVRRHLYFRRGRASRPGSRLQAAGFVSANLCRLWRLHCRRRLEAGLEAAEASDQQIYVTYLDFCSRPGLKAGLMAGGWTALEQQNCAKSWVFCSRPAGRPGWPRGHRSGPLSSCPRGA